MDAETTILTGLGSQTGGLSRWGDYTSMAIDPADDCTFWYDNQYQPANGSFNWTTRLASFSFPSCGSTAPDFTVAATPSSQSVVQGSSTTYNTTVTAVNNFAGTVNFNVSVRVEMTEFATWKPERIAAFFNGMAQVLAAKANVEKAE